MLNNAKASEKKNFSTGGSASIARFSACYLYLPNYYCVTEHNNSPSLPSQMMIFYMQHLEFPGASCNAENAPSCIWAAPLAANIIINGPEKNCLLGAKPCMHDLQRFVC